MSKGRSLRWIYGAVCAIALFPAAGLTHAAVLLGINDSNSGELYRISTAPGAPMTLVGNLGVPLATLECAPDGTLYGFTRGDTPKLYRVNADTADVEEIATITVPGALYSIERYIFEGSLAFSPQGVAYGVNLQRNYTNQLFTLDLNNGEVKIIAQLDNGPHDINGMVWYNDMLVGLDQDQNAIVQINPANGHTSILYDLKNINLNGPVTVGAIGGMTLVGDVAYLSTASELASPKGSNKLYGFDLSTNQLQYVGTFADTQYTKGIGALATPEPATMALLGLGCCFLARPRRWR